VVGSGWVWPTRTPEPTATARSAEGKHGAGETEGTRLPRPPPCLKKPVTLFDQLDLASQEAARDQEAAGDQEAARDQVGLMA